ncbi:major facilitator superfamily domain-containing protein [Ilyonectria robusta]|uniref:major facilitator superfamily domain-containing protein n=1 Tax=Ilyonectria robusta TaxID=1079257 RepID=UPI001E8D1212|nr:major facilitator superfamily domain-containing protein [Ilyonectria robusta]KAH8683850.1 major facilitator superfamily domain-containing protein [Ilyonectria robusta]
MDPEDQEQKERASESPFGHHESPEWKAAERRVVRKLDMTLMPMVWILYMFNYLDRNNIAQARLDDFESDVGLAGNQFNVAVSILNVGYMLAQLPSNMILTRVRPSIYLPCCVMVWSCISAATAGVTSFSGLIAVRFFLGIVEAPFFRMFLIAFFMLSAWYTRKELALRTAVLYSGLVLATAFSGLIAAGIFAGMSGVRGLHGWQWLFILEGTGSIVAAIIAFALLPDFPESKTGSGKWLFSSGELELAQQRIALDRVSLPEADRSVWHGLGLAVRDIRTWIFVVILCANHTAYGFNNFFPTIVKSMNLGSRTVTLVLTAPPYLFGAAISFLVAYSSDRHNERGYHIMAPMAVAIAGFIISAATLNIPARYFASFLYCAGAFAANATVYSWAASSLNQTPEKRACATAIVNLLSQLGNIWSPYFFPASDGPRYVMAMLLMMAFSVLSIIASMLMKFLLKKENKKMLAEAERTGQQVKLYTE